MSDLAATVVVPTTGDRGPLLPYSVGSALGQTERELEVLVIGDGVNDETRRVIGDLCDQDDRVRFFDFPKDVRRGEDNRHRVLSSGARGEIVCYLLDRDLWLPGHVEEMRRVLTDVDFGHTLRFRIDADEQISVDHVIDLGNPTDRAIFRPVHDVVPASMVGHTMQMYRRLPHGWRTTPPGIGTDRHMWAQFLDDPGCRVGSSPRPTVLAFKRGSHPGWSTPRRLEELERWHGRMQDPGFVDALTLEVWDEIIRHRSDQARQLRHHRQPMVFRWAERVLPTPQYAKVRQAGGRIRGLFRRDRA